MAETKAEEHSSKKAAGPEVEVVLPKIEVRTSDDAVQAYLHGHIDEKQLRDTLAGYGVVTLATPVGVERPDAAFERKIPDDLFTPPTSPYDDFAYRKGLVDEKEKARAEAVKKTEGENPDQTKARETAALTEQNTKRA